MTSLPPHSVQAPKMPFLLCSSLYKLNTLFMPQSQGSLSLDLIWSEDPKLWQETPSTKKVQCSYTMKKIE